MTLQPYAPPIPKSIKESTIRLVNQHVRDQHPVEQRAMTRAYFDQV
jgi:hypothetical protein